MPGRCGGGRREGDERDRCDRDRKPKPFPSPPHSLVIPEMAFDQPRRRFPEMSYLPAGSAVTDVHGGRVAGCGRHRRPRRFAGALLRPALALTAVGAASLVAAALALPAGESQRTIRFLEIARTTHARLIDHNHNGQPNIGDSMVVASDLFRWEGSRRGARLGHLWRVCILATADHRQLRRHRLPAGRDGPDRGLRRLRPRPGRARGRRRHRGVPGHAGKLHLAAARQGSVDQVV